MPRYEFSEGTSNKFWEINLSGKSFTTTYGKIGTGGQTTIKQFKSDADAKKEYDKLVAEKVKKGYEPANGSSGRAAADDDDDEDDDDDDKPAKKAATKKAAPAKAAPAKAAGRSQPPAAAKAAAKPAAKASGSDKGTPRYFEFSEGTSNKFWEIRLDGTSVRTKYGKIGTAGQQTLKDFPDAEKANKEYDKLVNEKTKKGYEEKDSPGGGDDHYDEIEE
ncbi:MAG: WGR domain-containing protein [Myxococcota bacterium]|nr:WGR domain-containing protein [Myxococcota bacterium]